jgi:hypothetical protein
VANDGARHCNAACDSFAPLMLPSGAGHHGAGARRVRYRLDRPRDGAVVQETRQGGYPRRPRIRRHA